MLTRRRFPGSAAIAAGAALLAAPQGLAAPAMPVLTDELQREAMSCAVEAAQICPEVWTASDHGLACMRGKRALFSPRCRAVYDDVARALGER